MDTVGTRVFAAFVADILATSVAGMGEEEREEEGGGGEGGSMYIVSISGLVQFCPKQEHLR